jgi:hypothetical protein
MTPVWGLRCGVAIEVDAVNSIVAKDVCTLPNLRAALLH